MDNDNASNEQKSLCSERGLSRRVRGKRLARPRTRSTSNERAHVCLLRYYKNCSRRMSAVVDGGEAPGRFHIFWIFSPTTTGLFLRISCAPISRQLKEQSCLSLYRCTAQQRPPQRHWKPKSTSIQYSFEYTTLQPIYNVHFTSNFQIQ